jgi:hypothetical protein
VVKKHRIAGWTAQELREAFRFDHAPKDLLRDRDGIFGQDFRKQVRDVEIKEVLPAPGSLWQRGLRFTARHRRGQNAKSARSLNS